MASTPGRNTARFQKIVRELRRRWKAARRPCWLCNQAIDYDAPFGSPDSCAADHIQPLSTHPHLAEDPANLAPSHRRCNESRGNRPPQGLGKPSRAW